MNLRFPSLRASLGVAFLGLSFAPLSALQAAPVPAPTFDPPGGALTAPVRVTVRNASAEASIHVTMDGKEPTPRDTEVDSGSQVVVDEPLTLKAKAWMPDGTVSATTSTVFALKPVPGNGASFVEQSALALLATGQQQVVEMTLRNTGKQPWIPATHTLAPYRAKDGLQWSVNATPLPESVATWKTATFPVTVTAPPVPGTYSLRFRMQSGSQGFGEVTPTLMVVVLSPADYQRQLKTAAGATGEAKPGASEAAAAVKKVEVEPLSKGAAAALAAAKSKLNPTETAKLDRLVRELQRSGRSFKYLHSVGYEQSDADFEKLIAEHPGLFRSVRIVRRDESGNRVIPGWPGIALQGKR